MSKKYRKSYLNLNEAKIQNSSLKNILELFDYILQTYNLSKNSIDLMGEIKYTSAFEEYKRDLEFKEERKDADVIIARKYLNDRKYKLDTVTLNEFSREHNKEIDTAIVHLGMYADEYTRSLNALAITIGNDIYFRNGAYKPETEEGRKTLAHELTHISQNKLKEEHLSTTKEELEKEALFEEQKEGYNPNPTIEYGTGKNKYKIKQEEGEKIDYSVEKELKEWVENQERNMSEEEYLRLLYKYQEYVERNQ